MQIVININENEYIGIKSFPNANTSYPWTLHLYDAVRNGTPLPKHHGRLIDADALTISHGVFVPRLPGDAKVFYGCPMDAVFADEIKNAETIIPATKEGAE